MTREEVVAVVGEEWVEAVEKENCECTSRLTDGTEWDGFTEFRADVLFANGAYVDFGNDSYRGISAFYYQKNEDCYSDEDIDLGSLDWEIDHYKLLD